MVVGLIPHLLVPLLGGRDWPWFPASMGTPERRRKKRRDSRRSQQPQQQQHGLQANSGTALLVEGEAAAVKARAESDFSIHINTLYLISAGCKGGVFWKGAKGE